MAMSEEEHQFARARTYLDTTLNINNSQTACLSSLPHELRDARDLRCHFFGCLGIKKRVDVLKDARHPIWAQAEQLQSEDTELHVQGPKSESQVPNQGDMRYITALNLQAELKRIKVLRGTPALKGLVSELSASVNDWRLQNKDNIRKVHELRQDSQRWELTATRTLKLTGMSLSQATACKVSSQGPPIPTFDQAEASRKELEQDLTEFSRTLESLTENDSRDGTQQRSDDDSDISDGSEPSDPSTSDGKMVTDNYESSLYDLRRDIKARLIKLKRPDALDPDASSFMADIMGPLEEGVANKIFKGSFPDQQVSVYHLIDRSFKRNDKHQTVSIDTAEHVASSKTGQLRPEKDCPSVLRYYHIPVNNMSVSVHVV